MIGQSVSHYRILEKIGQGGMGEIYLAEDTKLKRKVALKFLPRQMTADPDARERFEREAQAAAALNHPNIVTIYEIGEHQGQVFIAMEYVDGQTLKELIYSSAQPSTVNRLPISLVLDIATQLASGLAAAHAKGIVHRDVKPQNILVDRNNHVKILDFGLAKLKGVSLLTKESSTLGTVHYMSPEQTMGREVDHRTDIWSLGVVLYETLTGQVPFKGTYDQAVIYSILNEEPEPLAGLRPDAPAELQAIIGKCLEKEIDVRTQHADDLIADLKRAKRDSKPVAASTIHPKASFPSGKKRWPNIAAPTALAAVAAAIAGLLLFKDKEKAITIARTSDRPCVAVVYFENSGGDKSLEKWRSQLAELLITDLSQSRLLDVVSSDQVFSILKKLELLDSAKYSTEDLRQVADKSGSNYIVRGSFITAGSNLLINVALSEVKTGKTLSALRVESRGEEEIFSKVDEITRKIKLDLDFTPQELAADPDKELETITTRSPQAFAYYNEGQRQNSMGNYRQTIELDKKAVALDPDFAMAWRAMSINYANLGYTNEWIRYMKKAMEHLDRVSERERLLIAGLYYDIWEKTWPRAMESFQHLLRLYPNDYLARFWLGSLFDYLEKWDDAERLFTKNSLLRDEDISSDAVGRLAYMKIRMGQYQSGLQVLSEYQTRFPRSRYSMLYLRNAQIHLHLGAYDRALDAVDQATALSADRLQFVVTKGNIYQCSGDQAKAEALFRKMLTSAEPSQHAHGLIHLFSLYQNRGQLAEAAKMLRELLDAAVRNQQKDWEYSTLELQAQLDHGSGHFAEAQKSFDRMLTGVKDEDDWYWLRSAYYHRGMAYAEAEQFTEAARMAAELKAIIDKGLNNKLLRLHDHLQGLIALKKKDPSTTITLVKRAVSLLPGGDRESFRDTLGDAYFQAGRFEEARQAYEQITLSPTGRLVFEYARCLFKLGKTYQKLGDNEKAMRNFTQFIEYWSDCDTQFKPLLAEARAELNKLQERL